MHKIKTVSDVVRFASLLKENRPLTVFAEIANCLLVLAQELKHDATPENVPYAGEL